MAKYRHVLPERSKPDDEYLRSNLVGADAEYLRSLLGTSNAVCCASEVNLRVICTRSVGHTGIHVAHDIDRNVITTWGIPDDNDMKSQDPQTGMSDGTSGFRRLESRNFLLALDVSLCTALKNTTRFDILLGLLPPEKAALLRSFQEALMEVEVRLQAILEHISDKV